MGLWLFRGVDRYVYYMWAQLCSIRKWFDACLYHTYECMMGYHEPDVRISVAVVSGKWCHMDGGRGAKTPNSLSACVVP